MREIKGEKEKHREGERNRQRERHREGETESQRERQGGREKQRVRERDRAGGRQFDESLSPLLNLSVDCGNPQTSCPSHSLCERVSYL